jgi:cyclophilin family peptidyl-prolyl cis-trans isomerase
VLELVESPGKWIRFRFGKCGFVKKLMVTVWGRTGIAMAIALLVGLIGVPVSASAASAAKPSVSVLLPPAAAKKAGFTTVVNTPTASTSTGVSGCGDGVEEEFANAAGKVGLVAEVLYCSATSGAVALLKNVASADKTPGHNPPKGLGSTALERVGSDSSYLIAWRKGSAFELVGLSPDLAASSSTTTTTSAAVVPLTAVEQTQLSQAATEQNARFKAFKVSSSTPAANGSAANAKAQAKANAASVAAGCPKSPATELKKAKYSSAPAMTIDPSKTYTATVKTDIGTFTFALDAKNDPQTVNSFVFLAEHGFYNCVIFHRVIPQFMDQTGDPTGTGSGGPGYTIPDELPATASKAADQYPLGSVAMANTGQPHTGGSQFFIVAGSEGESLPASYSLFGHVTSGMKVVEQINKDGSAAGVPPDVTHRMLKVTISS